MRLLSTLIAAMLLLAPVGARAESTAPFAAVPYFDSKTIDLTQLLPAPPPP